MPDLGIKCFIKGQNFMRMLAGLGVALKISLISVVISIHLESYWEFDDLEKSNYQSDSSHLPGNCTNHATNGTVISRIFRDNASVWLGLIRRKCINYSIYILGSS